jgi:hypothetical protein
VLAAGLALVAQRLLGLPPLPPWSSALLIPMVLVVAPAARGHGVAPIAGLALGLGWDVVMGPVIGPGGIAWSAGALAVGGVAAVVANRSAAAWAAFGALGAAVVLTVQWLALRPLGLAPALGPGRLVVTAVLTGAWCWLVAWIESLDLAGRWIRWRSRRLRS